MLSQWPSMAAGSGKEEAAAAAGYGRGPPWVFRGRQARLSLSRSHPPFD